MLFSKPQILQAYSIQ